MHFQKFKFGTKIVKVIITKSLNAMANMIILVGITFFTGIASGLFLVTKLPKFWIRKVRIK